MCPNRHSPDYPIEDSVNRHSIPHRHTVTVTKVSSRLTDKDSQPPVYQVGLDQKMYILPGDLWAMLCTCHPYLNIPGHQATRSQLTANELGGIRFAGVGLSGPPYNPDQPEPTPSNNQGLWGSGVDIFPRRSHTYRGRRMPMGVTSNWCHPQRHHARRLPTTVPNLELSDDIFCQSYTAILHRLISGWLQELGHRQSIYQTNKL